MTDEHAATKPTERFLMIGLDGATWTNPSRWIERGDMPVLRRLRDEGAWGVLNSTIPALTPPAWASLVTGTNPCKHGIYHAVAALFPADGTASILSP
jgi:predicted AlkP superfamily phosphohydrolase/phosphomutase